MPSRKFDCFDRDYGSGLHDFIHFKYVLLLMNEAYVFDSGHQTIADLDTVATELAVDNYQRLELTGKRIETSNGKTRWKIDVHPLWVDLGQDATLSSIILAQAESGDDATSPLCGQIYGDETTRDRLPIILIGTTTFEFIPNEEGLWTFTLGGGA